MSLQLSITKYPSSELVTQLSHSFDQDGGSIGRAEKNDWVLPDKDRYVSSLHAEIRFSEGRFELIDTSTNGIYINHAPHPIERGSPVELRNGDSLSIGGYEIQVNVMLTDTGYRKVEKTGLNEEPIIGAVSNVGVESTDATEDVSEIDQWLGPEASPMLSSKNDPSPVVVSDEGESKADKGLDNIDKWLSPEGGDAKPFDALTDDSLAVIEGVPVDDGPPAKELNDIDKWLLPEVDDVASVGSLPQAEAPSLDREPEVEKGLDDIDKWLEPEAGSANSSVIPSESNPQFSTTGKPLPISSSPTMSNAAQDDDIDKWLEPDAGLTPSSFEENILTTSTPKEDQSNSGGIISLTGVTGSEESEDSIDTSASSEKESIPSPEFVEPKIVKPAVVESVVVQPKVIDVVAEATGSGDAGAIAKALGLDVNDLSPQQLANLNQVMTGMVKESISGLMDVLGARAAIKNEFRMASTLIQPVENNPLKFSVDLKEALENLFVRESNAYLGSIDSVRDGFQDIKNHQLAMLTGMREAFQAMFGRFDPEKLQMRFEKEGVSGLTAAGRKAKYWDAFSKLYQAWVEDQDSVFYDLFGEDFVRAYEDQMDEAKIR